MGFWYMLHKKPIFLLKTFKNVLFKVFERSNVNILTNELPCRRFMTFNPNELGLSMAIH